MKRLTSILAALALFAAFWAPSAQAEFGLSDLDVTFTNADGSPSMQAGSHPFQMSTTFDVNTVEAEGREYVDGALRDLDVFQAPGLVGTPTPGPRCTTLDFLNREFKIDGVPFASCADSTAVGTVVNVLGADGIASKLGAIAVYNLEAPPGVAAKLGFWIANVPITLELTVSTEPPYNVVGSLINTPQTVEVFSADLTLWGNPADPAHNTQRGHCLGPAGVSTGSCPANIPVKPFLTLPRRCEGPLRTDYELTSWWSGSFLNPGPPTVDAGFAETHDDAEPPNPLGATGCGKLGFAPRISSLPTTNQAETGSGLDFSVDFTDEGLNNPTGIAHSDIKKAEITFPEGMTINPSAGEGLGVCTPADLAREGLRSLPGAGCPNASKLGTLHTTTPLVDEPIDGSIFLAPQDDPSTTTPGAENPFDTLIALYFVIRNPTLGVLVKLPLKVEPDPNTGRLVATLEGVPQFPLAHFSAHLRTGARAALITPPSCDANPSTPELDPHVTEAKFTPTANPSQPYTTTSDFQITSGVNGGPCPSGGIPPFKPSFEAGAVNNNAGSFSPFNMRLQRADGEQDMTKFSSILPPGQIGSLAGVGKCPDAAVAIAKAKTGRKELASPSCPASSQIGKTLAGAGVGEALTYVGGQIYLAGPYKGAPLSVIAITPAVAGPFDAGTVVVRLGLDLNPKTAEVEVDGAASDPIPHILKGIVLKLRDLRVYVDRPNFTLNPTSCNEESVKATLFGSYLDVFNPADDVPVELSTRYQAANCQNLGFKPRLNLNLKGGTKRGGHPALKALYRPRPGDANLEDLVVRLPRSAFLDQAHIRTICTRVQFAAKACPKGAQYGFIKAWTPLLDEPLAGPVWLRSSNNKLPDLVFDLKGLVDVEVATRIDSQKGGIRATVQNAPDAPISKVELTMRGASKGLIVNSRDLCAATSRASVEFAGQNGKRFTAKPVMRAECGGERKRERGR